MNRTQECRFERLLADGSPVVRFGGQDIVVELIGLEILQPPGELYREIFEKRLAGLADPLRCEIEPGKATSRVRGRLLYLAWRDKSGDVWKDVAQLLLEQGLAKTAPGSFPERDQYLQYEQKSRTS